MFGGLLPTHERCTRAVLSACVDGDAARLEKELQGSQRYLDVRDACGLAPVHLAVKHGWVKCLQLLLDAGVDLESKVIAPEGSPDSHLNGYTATHLAAYLPGRCDVLSLLLKRGALHGRGPEGWTPLHCASFAGRFESMRLLVEHDADPNAQDNENRTPLFLCAKNGNAKAVRLLLAAGASIGLCDRSGYTPLHAAFDTRTQEVLQGYLQLPPQNFETAYLLVLAGCSVDAASDSLSTPVSFLSNEWRVVFTLTERYREELLRSGSLPFPSPTSSAPSHQSSWPGGIAVGVGFQELLNMDRAGLLSLGIPPTDAHEFSEALRVARLSFSTEDGMAVVAPSPTHRGRPTPPPQSLLRPWQFLSFSSPASPLRARYQRLRSKSWAWMPYAVVVLVVFVFWLGVMAQRHAESSLVLQALMWSLPDPFVDEGFL